jgi:hypothetical protein
MFIAKSLVFYPGYIQGDGQELSDEIILPSYHLNKLMEHFEDNEMLLVDITNRDKELSYMVAISTPHHEDKNTIYVPQWILDMIAYEDASDAVCTIRKAVTDDIPVATKIAIRPLDPIAFDTDILSCFEKTLMNLHSIKEGIIIPVQLPELGIMIYAQIEKVEPSPISRIINGEVDVEFINEFTFNVPVDAMAPPQPANEVVENTEMCWGSEPIEASNTNKVVEPLAHQPSAEERRQQVRDSWLKRFDKSANH